MPDLNVYAIVILAALLGDFVLERVADLLGLRALRREPPAELRGLYDPEEYARSQAYTRARTRLGIVSSTVTLAALLGFWLLGGFDALDLWLREELQELGPAGLRGPVGRGLVYLGALGLAGGLLSLPFSVYSTFVIEERFGFNRSTVGTFVLDLLKGVAVGVIILAPLVAAILWLFDRMGSGAWLVCWAVAAGYTLLVQWLGPRWILPLFNDFEPLEEGELREAVTDYVRSEGYDLDGVVVMDGSRRSSKANAFFTGFGRSKRLALFDTLIEKLAPSEVLAVVAHEIGHFKRGHIVQGIVMGVTHQGAVLFLLAFFLGRPGLYDAFFMTHEPLYAGFVFFGMLMTPVDRLLGLALNALSRRHELEADRYAVETTGRPEALASGLRKISADHLTNLTPHRFQVLLRHSHPPLHRRLRELDSS